MLGKIRIRSSLHCEPDHRVLVNAVVHAGFTQLFPELGVACNVNALIVNQNAGDRFFKLGLQVGNRLLFFQQYFLAWQIFHLQQQTNKNALPEPAGRANEPLGKRVKSFSVFLGGRESSLSAAKPHQLSQDFSLFIITESQRDCQPFSEKNGIMHRSGWG